MLEIDSFAWRGFMSYGDYVSELHVDKLGQSLITGEVINSGDVELPRESYFKEDVILTSNGAGKSAIPNVPLWVLFGRTMHSAAPGNKVLNWHSDCDCWGEVKFKNGDSISRTRTRKGDTEIVYLKNGDKQSLTGNTLSTSTNMQAKLNKEFGLDWDVFCGSVFFSQYGKPWMEMSDTARKQAMERMLRVDRFNLYGQVSKEKYEHVDNDRKNKRIRLNDIDKDTKRLNADLDRVKSEYDSFEQNKKSRIKAELEYIAQLEQGRDSIDLPDLKVIQEKWYVVSKIEQKIKDTKENASLYLDQSKDFERKSLITKSEAVKNKSLAEQLSNKVKDWEEKGGKLCLMCEREIPHDHVSQKIEPHKLQVAEFIKYATELSAEALQLDSEVRRLRLEYDKAIDNVKQIEFKLAERRPKMTIEDAKSIHRRYASFNSDIERVKARISQIELESNPLGDSMSGIDTRLTALDKERLEIEKEICNLDIMYNHLFYISKSYSDRKKVKAYALAENIPFINERLMYYLDTFELDLKMRFRNDLTIESDMWGYEFFCGGERKRLDIALMLAVFDLHEKMYGRQCNIIVLDEVDSRLDIAGINGLINIIKNDLANRVQAVLIISHRDDMHNCFPNQVRVTRRDRFSMISEVR